MVKVGFIGLGAMGLPMAKNIIKAGYETFVVSRSRPPIEEAMKLGAKEASSPRVLMETVDILFTCLPTLQSISDVYEGETGVIAGASSGKVVVDHSTVSPELSQRISGRFAEKGTAFMDAPISGGPKGATTGTLTIMCGGDSETFHKVYEILKVTGDYVVHVGPIGSGNIIKIINNMLLGVHAAALLEAYIVGEKAGIGAETFFNIIKRSSGYSKVMDWEKIVGRIMEEKKYNPPMLDKDLGLAVSLSNHLGVQREMVTLARNVLGIDSPDSSRSRRGCD